MRREFSRDLPMDWRTCGACHDAHGYCVQHVYLANRNQARRKYSQGKHRHPLVGPRVRLPQAKDVPTAVVLRALQVRWGQRHTHRARGFEGCACALIMPSLGCGACHPDLAAFPEKVLHAKLRSMARRGLIDGGGHVRSRGDWRLPWARK